MNRPLIKTLTAILVCAGIFWAMPALAEPHDWQFGFQDAASPTAERFHEFHNFLLVIITLITAFVMGLLLWVIVRYNSKVNPTPAQFSHNTMIEVIWTVIPVLILILIVVPSFKLLYFADRTQDADMTLKVTGYQWYWGYEYPDQDGLNFLSYMVQTDDLVDGQIRLLSTDNVVVLPIDTNIRILVTAADVLHAFALPALGVKIDAVPGRINETWMRINKPGIYYGQCSELCGKDHAFMPIEVHAVSKEEFEAWVATAKQQFSALDTENMTLKLAYTEGR